LADVLKTAAGEDLPHAIGNIDEVDRSPIDSSNSGNKVEMTVAAQDSESVLPA